MIWFIVFVVRSATAKITFTQTLWTQCIIHRLVLWHLATVKWSPIRSAERYTDTRHFRQASAIQLNAARFVQTINPHPMPTADTMSKYQSLWKSKPNRLSANLLKGFYIAVWKAYTYRIVILSLDRNHFLVSTLNYVYWTEEVNLSYDGMAHQVTNDSLSELEQKIDTFFKSG